MSAKKKKAPAQDSAPVGYGRPPAHSRFRKGQSGNPTGKRRHGEAERVQALIWEEAYRQLTVREGDKVTRMPAVQAVLRTQIASALKGNVSTPRSKPMVIALGDSTFSKLFWLICPVATA